MKQEIMMDISPQFRSRKPPRKEVLTKFILLFLFGVFCATVSVFVSPLPLPEPRQLKPRTHRSPTDDAEIHSFSTLSPEERMTLAELSARLSVPYLTPWGEDERPALFFMWHLLYRSIKPDLEHFTADLHNVTVTTSPSTSTTSLPLPATNASTALSLTATTTTTAVAAAAPPQEKLRVVIHVVESEYGYITASLTRFLPEAFVFSVVVNSSNARRPYSPRFSPRGGGAGGVDGYAGGLGTLTFSPEMQGYAERVAAKVERVLADPAAENVTEASNRPGVNRLIESTATTTTTSAAPAAAVGDGEETETTTAVPAACAPNLFLCVPANVFNGSYFSAPATSQLSANYQVLLSPYLALRTAQTAGEFDAILRAILTHANVASFIVLPWLWEDEGAAPDGDAAQLRRAQVYAKELDDFDRWYGESEGFPLRILERALRVPEIERQYQVSITPLGSKRWAGVLRELFRVELSKVAAVEAANLTTTTTATTATANPTEEGGGENKNAAATPSTTAPTSLFGCTSRRDFLQCASRQLHSNCERFSDNWIS